MSDLLPCPCGKTPTQLNFYGAVKQTKWAMIATDCCGDWLVEFKNGYSTDPAESMAKAVAAWNEAPRDKRIIEALREQTK